MWGWLFRKRTKKPLTVAKGWIQVGVPREVAKQIGRTSKTEGITLAQAVGAACWFFSTLTYAQRYSLIVRYLTLTNEGEDKQDDSRFV